MFLKPTLIPFNSLPQTCIDETNAVCEAAEKDGIDIETMFALTTHTVPDSSGTNTIYLYGTILGHRFSAAYTNVESKNVEEISNTAVDVLHTGYMKMVEKAGITREETTSSVVEIHGSEGKGGEETVTASIKTIH